MKIVECTDGFMVETLPCEYLTDAEGNNLFESKAEAKRTIARQKIDQAAARVDQAIAENKPAYIVRARRNALFVAHSDAALLEAHIRLNQE